MHRHHQIIAVLFTLAVVLFALVASAGHRPVCCKGYLYWDILDKHGAGHQWRKVGPPITLRAVPIEPSIWNVSEAAQRALLVMMSRAQLSAGSSQTKVRSWDAICWHYGESEPIRHSWPVQP